MAKNKNTVVELVETTTEIEVPYELPEGWKWCKLGDVCKFENGYAFKADKFSKTGIPVIRITNIKENEIDLSDCIHSGETNIDDKFLVRKGDLLIAMSGATTGKNGVYLSEEKVYLNQRVGNIKVIDNNKAETEINAPGPIINKEDVMNLAKKLAKIKKEDIVVISGGLPKSLSLNTFDSFVKFISTKDIYLVVNIYSSALLKIIKYKPFLVDLNESELADTLFTRVETDDDCVKGARHLLKLGAKNVLITRGDKGAIFVNDDMTIKAKAMKGEVKNTVGAGDSLLAAFIDEYIKTESFEKAIKKTCMVYDYNAYYYSD